MRMTGDEAASAAKSALSTLSICFGAAALAAVVAVAPANAKKSKDAEEVAVAADANQPMTLIVSLRNQKVDIYRGTTLITSSRVSTGKRGYATKAGVFSILEKRRRHYSNLYGGAPMPWMQRLTWSGTALHAGVVPGYPASHGCIRLPYSFAPKLFSMTDVGAQVVISHGQVAPKMIQHSALFQPLPPPAPPVLAKDHDQHAQRRTSNEVKPLFGPGLPVVLAKAETGSAVTDVPATTVPYMPDPAPMGSGHATDQPAQEQVSVSVATLEDTRVHAIDPNAGPVGGNSVHAVAIKSQDEATQDHAAVDPADDLTKHQDRLTPQAETVAAPADQDDALTEVSEPQDSAEPPAGAILTVVASALDQPARAPVTAVVSPMLPFVSPPLPPEKPSVIAAKFVAGAAAAAVEAAEPLSTAPLRILVTRRTKRDEMRDVQYILSSMGYLEPQNFDGTFGSVTARAIKAFQKDNELPETGAFTDDLVKKVYEVAGKDAPPQGHLFVRQEFASVFDTPVRFRNPDAPLGTHVFMVMDFKVGDTKAEWISISLDDKDDPTVVLDRLVIPDDVRRDISERLTPGSSLIIAETSINTATLPKGADFLVWDTSKPQVQRASVRPKPRVKRRTITRRRSNTTYSRRRSPNWPFF